MLYELKSYEYYYKEQTTSSVYSEGKRKDLEKVTENDTGNPQTE